MATSGRSGTTAVRADHGWWSTGWGLFGVGIARTARPRRRLVMFVSIAVVAAGVIAAIVIGLQRDAGFRVVVLTAVGALVALLAVAIELVIWSMLERRRIDGGDESTAQRIGDVRAMIRAGRASEVLPADRRNVARFGQVQQLTLPATVLVHIVVAIVFAILGVIGWISGGSEWFVVLLAAVVFVIDVVSLVGTIRALGTTPELVALGGTVPAKVIHPKPRGRGRKRRR